ncbi:hypothetical protein OO013_00340 [Mangrovivirga sp. M17]|uniref:Co-chaperone DjlA N-terminal domain-containing protein n=1 Tax=Mangrovivirga halotolerans TaxID=2993936 RepID=A0ABT3RKD6_9BACT|nr:TerB family tellurite resistance protein [Mangrovivirga halotolerans]MCX2742286.1 hypothetical protein [Mangrovivirga halotolerans]
MGILEKLFGNDTKEKKSHLRNLILVALVDGKIDKKELDLLKRLSENLDISKSEFENLIENPHIGDFVVPKSYDDKMLQVLDLVAMIIADGKIQDEERDLCKSIALKLNINPKVIDDLLLKVRGDLEAGKPKEEVIRSLYQE